MILAVIGPTASGKSALALALASRQPTEIVTCDSMQIYRGLDIGTAKPTAAERAEVPHHLIDLVDPPEVFSAQRWADAADAVLADVAGRGRMAIVVGGTGLYLRALRWGLVETTERDNALRESLLAAESADPGVLHRRLAEVDPVAAARLHRNDLQRVTRALEVFQLTGRTLSSFHAAHQPTERHPMTVLHLDPPATVLDARLADRAAAMVQAGLVEETGEARARWGQVTPLSSVGYHEAGLVLDGKLPLADLPAAVTQAHHQFARRQRTWFKKEPTALTAPSAEAGLQLLVDRGLV